MSQQVTGTSWLAVMIASLAGFGLLLTPAAQTDRLRSLLRDVSLPGLRVLDVAHRQMGAVSARLDRDLTVDVATAELIAERDQWMQKYRELESVYTQLVSAVEQAREEPASPFLADPGTPLFVPELIEASIVGAEEFRQLTQRTSFRHIIDVGTHDDVIPADFVVNDTLNDESESSHLLDQGADSGLQLDQPVFAGRCVVGKVGQVGRWTSTIIPVTDPEFTGRAQLVRSTTQGAVLGAAGVITGDGEGKCQMKYVPGTEPVAIGDVVYTPVGHSQLPVPMFYGTVVQATLGNQAQNWTIIIEPAESIENAKRVQVLRSVLNAARTSHTMEGALPTQPGPSS